MADDALHDALVVAFHETQHRLWIVTPYFLPTPSSMVALSIAARRGVDVRIVVPQKSNQRLADLARRPWLGHLHEIGVHIHRYPKMLHAKAILTDNAAFLGSANFDARSLLLNQEVKLLLQSTQHVATVVDWEQYIMVGTAGGLPQISTTRRMLESVFMLVSPVL